MRRRRPFLSERLHEHPLVIHVDHRAGKLHDAAAQLVHDRMGISQVEGARRAHALAQEVAQPLLPATFRLGPRKAAYLLLGGHGRP